ncbi:MAG TPA: hypothetical protein VGM92_01615 [Candidatus Kapabacteria bacterium]
MPLALGNMWIGRVTNFNAEGIQDSAWADTLMVTNATVVHGELWFYMNTFWLTNDTAHAWFTNRADGLYRCDNGNFSQAYRSEKYPAQSGDNVVTLDSTIDSDGNGVYNGIVVDSTGVMVTVPAGTYSCYVYSGRSYSRDFDDLLSVLEPSNYYSPGTGIIESGYSNLDGTPAGVAGNRMWQLVKAILH